MSDPPVLYEELEEIKEEDPQLKEYESEWWSEELSEPDEEIYERHDIVLQKRREKGQKAKNGEKQGYKNPPHSNKLAGEDKMEESLIGEKRSGDHPGAKKRKAEPSQFESSIECKDMQIENESDRKLRLKIRKVKENWDDSSDEEEIVDVSLDQPAKKEKPLVCEPVTSDKDHQRLRSPVICVLGHVDTGKTKLLDFIRKTHVQDGEAGGITQQIGATMIPRDALREKCRMANGFPSFDLKLPGLLVIDTPGHESFRNLRSRGISMCDMAILVVDVMHGLEPQTVESLNLLRDSKTPFVVALNKMDRLYGWKGNRDADVEGTVKAQSHGTRTEFEKRCQEIVAQFANEKLNAAPYYENPDPRAFVSMVPTSAITGDGMGNLLSLIAMLTQIRLHKKLIFEEELQASVLEVKVIPGLGTTIDVILVNGKLSEGDTIVLAGREGPIEGRIRSLLTPHPLQEMRVKNQYVEHKSIEGAAGVKISGTNLEMAMAGVPLYVAREPGDVERLKQTTAAFRVLENNCIKKSSQGVYVHAPTLGSLEALLEHLTSQDIPSFSVKIGPVVKKDVIKASAMLEHDVQYATVIAFDVKVEREAQEAADAAGVKIICVDVIYHAIDEFIKHREECLKEKEEALRDAVFPCVCQAVTSGRESFEVLVEKGRLRVGTPLNRKNQHIGVVKSMSAADGSSVDTAEAGQKVTVRVKSENDDKFVQVKASDSLISRVSRKSYHLCKKYCKKDFSEQEWDLMLQLRTEINVLPVNDHQYSSGWPF